MKRKTITTKQMRDILLIQAFEAGRAMPCVLCGLAIHPHHMTIVEHLHALALGGEDHISNMRLVHKQCADRKTRGTKATTAGSDIQQIAKGKRLRGETGKNKRKVKIPSRGFQKGAMKRMPDGRVVPR